MKAILIVRVSTHKQEQKEQEEDLIKTAISQGYKEKNLIPIDTVESAITNKEKDMEGLTMLKEHINKDKSINAVFLWELSRLARTMEVGISIRDFLISNQIQLYCLNPKITLLDEKLKATQEGKLAFSIFLQLSENEMEIKKARFKRSKVRNAKSGKFSGGFLKFGYYVDDNGYYQINEDEAKLIREVFNRYETGVSIFKLTKEFLERGKVKTQNLVRNILISEEYTGQYTGEFATDSIKEKNKKLERVYPQIISREQFLKCKEIANQNNKRADKTNEIYLAHSLIKCVECGTTYIAMKSSIQYLCYGRYGKEARLNKDAACKASVNININILDTIVWRVCRNIEVAYRTKNLKKYKEELLEKIEINNEKIDTYLNRIVDEEDEMERTNNLYIKGRIKEDSLDKKYSENEKNIRTFNNEISKLKSENQLLNNNIVDSSDNTSVEDIRKINDDLYGEDSLIEKQKIVKRHIKYINIIDEVPNHTRIVKIYSYLYKTPFVYRVHMNKKPQLIEEASGGVYAKKPYSFTKVGFEVVKRFVKQNGKTVTMK